MNTKISLLFFLAISLIGCNSKESGKTESTPKKTVTETDFRFDGLPAYSISKDIDAIVFELGNYGEEKLFQNQIYTEVQKEDTLYVYEGFPIQLINSTYVDTTGQFNIFRNLKIEKRIKEKLKPSYYVYGTKGYTKATLGEVYFTVDECLSNIIAVRLNNYDREKYGNPLFCSEERLDIIYGKTYTKVEKAINQYDKIQNRLADYSNKPNCNKVVANVGSNYFTYEDDFNWKKDFSRNDINFPGRALYTLNENGKISCNWGYSLDLLGIPCD